MELKDVRGDGYLRNLIDNLYLSIKIHIFEKQKFVSL